jgi:hypothetical protein
MFACTAGWAQEPPASARSPDLSFFDFLGSMVADEDAGWIDPLDLYENYEAELALMEQDAPQALEDGVSPSEEVDEDE